MFPPDPMWSPSTPVSFAEKVKSDRKKNLLSRDSLLYADMILDPAPNELTVVKAECRETLWSGVIGRWQSD